jgi:hypothetical protein
MSMLARENRACAAGKSDKAALAEVHEALKRHYQARRPGGRRGARAPGSGLAFSFSAARATSCARAWASLTASAPLTRPSPATNPPTKASRQQPRQCKHKHMLSPPPPQVFLAAFTYYAAAGGNDPYHLPLNAFTSFLDDAAIPDPDSLYAKRSDCDTIFIVANFVSDRKRRAHTAAAGAAAAARTRWPRRACIDAACADFVHAHAYTHAPAKTHSHTHHVPQTQAQRIGLSHAVAHTPPTPAPPTLAPPPAPSTQCWTSTRPCASSSWRPSCGWVGPRLASGGWAVGGGRGDPHIGAGLRVSHGKGRFLRERPRRVPRATSGEARRAARPSTSPFARPCTPPPPARRAPPCALDTTPHPRTPALPAVPRATPPSHRQVRQGPGDGRPGGRRGDAAVPQPAAPARDGARAGQRVPGAAAVHGGGGHAVQAAPGGPGRRSRESGG